MPREVDALIIGAGFGGIYQLYSLLKQELSVQVIDAASDFGGTWYWNRYPGAMSDTESYVYRYSWDKEDLQQYPWTYHYVKQPDVLAYLEHVVERHGLRPYMKFNTEMLSADWDPKGQWIVQTNTGETFVAHYLVTALGLLSKIHYPDISGLDSFRGKLLHTAAWPRDMDLKDKRVGIIGSGSTGVQIITDIAKDVKELISFQRTPQYTVPSGDKPVSPEYRKWVNENYDEIVAKVRNSTVGFGFEESTRITSSVSAAERRNLRELVATRKRLSLPHGRLR